MEREITPMMTGEALAQAPMSASNSATEQDIDDNSEIDSEEEASE